jgi:hypothetical protein
MRAISFSNIESLSMLYFDLLGTPLRLPTPTNFERTKKLCISLTQQIIQNIQYRYEYLSEKLNFQRLSMRMLHIPGLF